MAVFRLSSRGATRLAVAVTLAGIALVAFLQPRGLSAPAMLFQPGDTTAIYGPRTFTTPTGAAVNFTERFTMTVVPGKQYFLRLVNGDPAGGHRVTSGQVRLNGWGLISSAELASGATLQKVITARSQDTLFATVQGTAGAYVTVSVMETADPTFLVFGPGHFIRGTTTPVTETRTFTISATAASPYSFCLTNGDVNGANRVSSATILINRQQVFAPANFNQQVSSLTAQVTLQRANTLSVTLAGKPAGFVDICVTATDVTAPVITITAPPNNFITRDTTVTVSGTVQDETPTTVTINGLAAAVTNSGFSKVIPLSVEGRNAIHIVARDRAGHITDSLRTVIRDRTPPVLTVNAPPDGFITNQATVVVSGTVRDSTAVTVRVNGTPLTVGQGGAFSGSLSLTEGLNQLTITATDAVANATSVLRSVRLDTHPPVLTVTAPVDGLLTNQASLAVTGTVTDETAVTVNVNGTPLTVGPGGAISGSVSLSEGLNALTFTAIDAAGNQTPVTRNVTLDTQPPVLTVSAPAEGLITNQTTVVVSGTATDAHTVTVNVNGTPLPVGQGGAFSGSIALTEGHNTLTVTASDAAGNQATATRHVIRDTIAPVLIVNAPVNGFITKQTSIVVAGTVTDSNAVTLTVNGFSLTVGAGGAFSGAVPLIEGHNTLLITARDTAGNETPAARTGISDTQAPVIVVSAPAEGDTIATASVNVVGTVSDSTNVVLTVNGDTVLMGPGGPFTKSVSLVIGANTIALVATDQATNVATLDRHVVRKNPLPPNPATVASVVNRAEATLVQENTAFLYSGASPIQTGVAPGTIAFLRAAVIRGRVLDRQLQPLGGAIVTVKNHPELGQTLSRDDGGYDLAVNGGGSLVLDFAKGGYLPAQRALDVAWQDYTTADDVILVQLDTAVTVVDLTTQDIQVARGSSQTDGDGARQATVFFEPGTQATLRRADGTTQTLTSLVVRATEFTVGGRGDEAMPAVLPPSSQYTYAVQVTADAQLTAGPGARITFNQPVPLYVENFLDFPVGTAVPTGAYDPDSAKWFPRPNGIVIRITGTDAQGRALLDINGDGIDDSDSLLVFNGIDPLERVKLAGTYPINSRLWRVPIIETLPHDLNWPFTLLGGDEPKSRVTGPCGSEGADVLRCSLQVQTAFQQVGIVGSPFTLNYASDRTQGNVLDRQLNIQLVGPTIPAFLNRVDLEINIAGKQFETSFVPTANLNYTFVWDGKDAYGRTVQQTQPATVRIGYLYPVVYSRPAPVSKAFGLPCTLTAGDCTLDSMPPREEDVRALRRVWETLPTTLGGFDATGAGLGGFTLDVQHAYDPLGGILYSGDGSRRAAATLPEQITRFAGTGNSGFVSDPMTNGVPATQSLIGDPAGIAVGPDGSVYFTDRFRNRVRKVDPNGIISLVAGSGGNGAFSGDGGPATAAKFSSPKGLALGPDGSLYIADESNQRIRRVRPDGIITTFAGTGVAGYNGDTIPATAANLNLGGGFGGGIAVGPDGSVYFADINNHRIRRIGLDGIITTVAGNGVQCFIPGTPPATPGQFESTCLDNVPATRAKLRFPRGLAIGLDGSIYFSQGAGGTLRARIQRVDPQGIIHLVGGKDFGASPVAGLGDGGSALQAQFFAPWALGIGPDGSVYVSDELGESGGPGTGFYRVRRIRPDGLINTVVGDGVGGNTGDGGPARRARINRVEGIAFMQDGTLLISDDAMVRKVSPSLPGLAGGQQVIASVDGSELYVFSAAGRILMTLDALTTQPVQRFVYDDQRRLVAITDRNGDTTTIQRDGAGRPTGILAPNGQPTVFTLNPDGTVAAVTDAGNETLQLQLDASGLLNGITDFNGNSSSIGYDASGRLLTSTAGPGTPSVVRSVVTTASGDELHYTSAAGVDAFGQVASLPGGGRSYQGTLPDGRVMSTTVGPDGTVTTHFADGTVATATPLPDPLFGMQTPGSRVTTTLPSGLVHDQRAVRAVTLATPGDPLSLVQQVDSLVTNGRIALTTFNKTAGTRTRRTPTGRVFASTLDAAGRETSETAPGMFPVSYEYDSTGRVTRIAQSVRVETRIYGPSGLLQQTTDALGRVARRSHTATGLLTELIRPGGDTVRFEYDANGNQTAIVPPGRPPHLFGFTAIGRRETYTAPPVGPTPTVTRWSYNADGALIGVEHPDGGDVVIGRDSANHVRTVTSPTGQQTYAYDPASGRVATAVSEHGVVTSFNYDGLLLKSTEWSGPAVGKVSNVYDANHWLISEGVGNGAPIQFENDLDGLPTRAGALTISRNAASGAITGTTLGGLTSQWVMDGYGDLASFEYRFGGAVVLRLAYTRDALARAVAVSEIRNSDSTGTAFGFDSIGGLTSVVENGVPMASYEYDANGNRTLVTTPSGTMQGTVDAQDRLLTLGANSYTYSPNGQVVEKVTGNDTTRYEYDGALRLTAVSLPSGQRVTYLLDADGRRVARAIGGVVDRRFVYGSGFKLVAEVDGTGSATSRFVYGTRANVPDYMVKNGTVYGLVTDQAGSVRLVIDATNGAIAQELDYDAFGRVTVNTNPGFQPFAFAGGLLDYETGLMHFGVRDYDPFAGRWISKDPVVFSGGEWNLYTYAHNDPINYIDPTGTWSLPEMAFTMGWQSLLKFVRNKVIENIFFDILETAAERAITGCFADMTTTGQKKGCLANARDEALGLGGMVAIGTDVLTHAANPFASFVINCGIDGVTEMIAADYDAQDKSLVLGCVGGGLQEMVDISMKVAKAGAAGPVARAVAVTAKVVIGFVFMAAQKRYQTFCEDEPRSLRCRFN